MTAKKNNRKFKPDTTINPSHLDAVMDMQREIEKNLVPVRINRKTIVLTNKEKQVV